MNRRKKAEPGLLRLTIALAAALAVLAILTLVIPWHFPYDRLEHLYAVEGIETIPVGHPGGTFMLLCASINEEAEVELLVDGEVYAAAERIDKERYRVTLGAELFTQPRRLELTLRERYGLPIYLRSNTIHLYVTQ